MLTRWLPEEVYVAGLLQDGLGHPSPRSNPLGHSKGSKRWRRPKALGGGRAALPQPSELRTPRWGREEGPEGAGPGKFPVTNTAVLGRPSWRTSPPNTPIASHKAPVTSTVGSYTFPRILGLLNLFGGLEVGCGPEPPGDLVTPSPPLPPFGVAPPKFTETSFDPSRREQGAGSSEGLPLPGM